MNIKLKNVKIDIIQLLAWASVILFCVTFVMSTRYTVLWTDDYSHQRRMNLLTGSQLSKALQYTKNTYMTWQGTFFTIFLQSILSPAASESLRKLRIISMLNSSPFFASIIVVVKAFQNYYSYNAKRIVFVVISIIFPLFSYSSYGEVLYWYSGQTAYTYPLSIGLLSIAALLFSLKNKKTWLYIISLIFVFLACGGSLTVSGMIFYISVVFAIFSLYAIYKNKENGISNDSKYLIKRISIFIIVSFISSAINGLAPGNYARHGDRHTSLFDTVYYAFLFCIDEFDKFVIHKETAFLLFAFLMFSVGFMCKKKFKLEEIIVGSLFSSLFPIVALFPILYGYGYNAERTYFPNRAQFILDFSYIVSFQLIMFSLGLLVREVIREENRVKTIFIICMIMIVFILRDSTPVRDTMPVKVATALCDDSLRDSADRITKAYRDVKESDAEDVAVLYPIEAVEWFDVFTLSDNPSDWSNQGIAGYYGKKSVGFYRELE